MHRMQANKVKSREDLSTNDMQDYLISNVLYDGKGQVKTKARKKLGNVVEEDREKDIEEMERKAKKNAEEIKLREKHFEDYRSNMEEYLSLFENDDKNAKIKRESLNMKAEELSRKPVQNLGMIKNKFENFEDSNNESKAGKISQRGG